MTWTKLTVLLVPSFAFLIAFRPDPA